MTDGSGMYYEPSREGEMSARENLSVISNAAGFALMKSPSGIDMAYERSPVAERSRKGLQELRTRLRNVKPAHYRGIERCPLSEEPLAPLGWAGAVDNWDILEKQDKKARARLRDFLGPNHVCEYSPCCVVPMFEQAVELLSLVDSPSDYEIARLSKASSELAVTGNRFFGLDVADQESLADLAILLASLNQQTLFPDYQSAERFREYYRAQPWAETEDYPGEFCIIRVERAPVENSG